MITTADSLLIRKIYDDFALPRITLPQGMPGQELNGHYIEGWRYFSQAEAISCAVTDERKEELLREGMEKLKATILAAKPEGEYELLVRTDLRAEHYYNAMAIAIEIVFWIEGVWVTKEQVEGLKPEEEWRKK